MKSLTAFQTFDGVTHTSYADATKYLNKLYASALCSVSTKLAQIDKYSAMCEFVDSNLHTFEYLMRINADKVIADNDYQD